MVLSGLTCHNVGPVCVDVMDHQPRYLAFEQGSSYVPQGRQSGRPSLPGFASQAHASAQGQQYGNMAAQSFDVGLTANWPFDGFQCSIGSNSQLFQGMPDICEPANELGPGPHLFQGIHEFVKPAETGPWCPGDGQQQSPSWNNSSFSTLHDVASEPSLNCSRRRRVSEDGDSGYRSAISTDRLPGIQTGLQYGMQAIKGSHDHYDLLHSSSALPRPTKSIGPDHIDDRLQVPSGRRDSVGRARPKYKPTQCEMQDCNKRLKSRSEAKYAVTFTIEWPNLTMGTGSIMSSTQKPMCVMSKVAPAENLAPVSRH